MSERTKTVVHLWPVIFTLYLLRAKGFIKHFDGDTMYQVTRYIAEREEEDVNYDPVYFPLRSQWCSLVNCPWERILVDLRDPSILEHTAFCHSLERGPDIWWVYCYQLSLPLSLSLSFSAVVLLIICTVPFICLARRLQ